MPKIVDKYRLDTVIGSGQFGKVYKALNMNTNQEFAVKAIKRQIFEDNPKLKQFVVNEIQTLSRINNENVVKFLEMITTVNHIYFVYEFCNGGTLEDAIFSRGYYLEAEAMTIFNQIIKGLNSVIQLNIIHRDLKPQNILFHEGKVKIADFGFCKQLESRKDLSKTILGSPIYMAPEILLGEEYTMKADIWSLGVMLYEMLYGKCPFEGKNIAQLIDLIHEYDLNFPEQYMVSEKIKKLIIMMLSKDPNKRIEWEEICEIAFNVQKPTKIIHSQIKNMMQTTEINVNSMKPIEMTYNKPVNLQTSQNPLPKPPSSQNNISNSQNTFIINRNLKLDTKNDNFENKNLRFESNSPSLNSPSLAYSSPVNNTRYYTPNHHKDSQQSFQTFAVSRDVTPSGSGFIMSSDLNQTFSNTVTNFDDKSRTKSNFSSFSIQNTSDNFIKIQIQNPIKDKDAFSLFLNKELMKIYYLSQVFANLHVYSLETDCKNFEFMFLKYLYFQTKKLKESLIDKIDLEISMKISNVLEFIKSPEYHNFEKELITQYEKISSLFLHQKKQYFQPNTPKESEDPELENDNIFNFKRFVIVMFNAIEKIKIDYLFSKNERYKMQDSAKYIIFLNELIDSILIEELFTKFIIENNCLKGQQYFEEIKNTPVDAIIKLVAQKIEYAKKKYNF